MKNCPEIETRRRVAERPGAEQPGRVGTPKNDVFSGREGASPPEMTKERIWPKSIFGQILRRHAATVVMVVIAAALGLWLWLDRGRVTSSERKAREGHVFSAWRKDELRNVTIEHEGETIVLVREGQEWRMRSPREERTDAAAVDRLLTTLEFATIARRTSEGTSLGLGTPRARGTVTMGALVIRFALGGPSPRPENSSYLRVDDGAPFVVGQELTGALLASSDVYRDRTVVPYLATELARFEVKHSKSGFALERIDERNFKVAGEGLLAARSLVDRMWVSLASMRAEVFPNDADVERLVTNPALTITMTPKDAARPRSEIVIGDACPGHPADVVVVRRSPTRVAACAPKDIVNAFLATGTELLERRAFTRTMDEVEELRLERVATGDAGAPAAIEIARKAAGFHQREPTDRDLSSEESDAANELITRVTKTEADTATHAVGAFTAVARARIRSGDHEESVEIGAPDAKGHAVLRRTLDDARLDAGPALVRLLMPRETSLRAARIVATDTRAANRVILRCGTDQELADRGEGFRLVAPVSLLADGAIAQLVDAILKGRGELWVSDVDDGTFGFEPDGCRVTLSFADGNAPVTVSFGAEGEGGVYARASTRNGVFVAPKALRELAGRLYVSRGSLRVEASRIESVRVTLEGRPVVRERSALREAVASLFADRVVSLGTKGLSEPDLVIDVSIADGGAPRRIACRPAGAERLCTAVGVDATFALRATKLAPFLPPKDAGSTAED